MNDQEFLNRMDQFKGKKKVFLWIFPIIFFVLFCKELLIVFKYISYLEVSFLEALSLWGGETYANETYSGAETGLKLRFDRAVYTLLVFAMSVYYSWHETRAVKHIQSISKEINVSSNHT